MQLSQETTSVLKNFASINPNLLVKPGKSLRTISPTKSVMARAIVDESFDKGFAIFDLSQFLGRLSLFDKPELTISDSFMEISEGEEYSEFAFAAPENIVAPPEKEITLPKAEINFELTEKDFSKVMKAMSVSGLPEIAVTGEDGKLSLQAIDSKGVSKDVFTINIGKTKLAFRMIFRADNLKIIPGDYTVAISSKGLAHFKSEKVEYWIAVEQNSKFEG